MSDSRLHCLLISDFNLSNLQGYLRNDRRLPLVRASSAVYGQVLAPLLEATDPCWEDAPDIAVIWTRPEAVLPSFGAVLEHRALDSDALDQEVDRFAQALLGMRKRVRAAFIPTWVVPPQLRGLGVLDMGRGGVAATLARINLRLAERLASAGNLIVLDALRWLLAAGPGAWSSKFWYMSKTPFQPQVFREAVADIKAGLSALVGKARKLLIVDLDDTLWGGIVGEVGWQKLNLGGHDPQGEAFVDFQRALKSLQNRGVILGVASKNDEDVALEAIDRHPEMVLHRSNFAGWKINWRDKAANVADLVHELNLGLDAAVFIDDNPAERARVAEALPEVLVPDWPADKMRQTETLWQLRCFDQLAITPEDAARRAMYAIERERRKDHERVGDLEEWLGTLDMKLRVTPLESANLARTAQLLNKTNQMNLSTRRMIAEEITSWVRAPGRRLWTLRLADRFGDYGLIGVVSVEHQGDEVRIVDFLLSCRVFGRKIENVMAAVAIGFARGVGVQRVTATYRATARNRPCLEFFEGSGFDREGDTFSWLADRDYPLPAFLNIDQDETAA